MSEQLNASAFLSVLRYKPISVAFQLAFLINGLAQLNYNVQCLLIIEFQRDIDI